MNTTVTALLAELESFRGNPVIAYAGMIEDDALAVVYECLSRIGKTKHLDLFLSTKGGYVMAARRAAMLLREYTSYLSILVPLQAGSAGTLLCLSANELVLGPLAALSPIDPQISSAGPPPPDAPGMISAEDIRAFPRMAQAWFGVQNTGDQLQVLAMLAQRVFPVTLGSFYRSHELICKVATEMLSYQLPKARDNRRRRIVEQLVSGYSSHDYAISRSEARQLGLRATAASKDEDALMWNLEMACSRLMAEQSISGFQVCGLIASAGFCARRIRRQIVDGDAKNTIEMYWELNCNSKD